MWILGNATTLERSPVWSALIQNARQRGSITPDASPSKLFPSCPLHLMTAEPPPFGASRPARGTCVHVPPGATTPSSSACWLCRADVADSFRHATGKLFYGRAAHYDEPRLACFRKALCLTHELHNPLHDPDQACHLGAFALRDARSF